MADTRITYDAQVRPITYDAQVPPMMNDGSLVHFMKEVLNARSGPVPQDLSVKGFLQARDEGYFTDPTRTSFTRQIDPDTRVLQQKIIDQEAELARIKQQLADENETSTDLFNRLQEAKAKLLTVRYEDIEAENTNGLIIRAKELEGQLDQRNKRVKELKEKLRKERKEADEIILDLQAKLEKLEAGSSNTEGTTFQLEGLRQEMAAEIEERDNSIEQLRRTIVEKDNRIRQLDECGSKVQQENFKNQAKTIKDLREQLAQTTAAPIVTTQAKDTKMIQEVEDLEKQLVDAVASKNADTKTIQELEKQVKTIEFELLQANATSNGRANLIEDLKEQLAQANAAPMTTRTTTTQIATTQTAVTDNSVLDIMRLEAELQGLQEIVEELNHQIDIRDLKIEELELGAEITQQQRIEKVQIFDLQNEAQNEVQNEAQNEAQPIVEVEAQPVEEPVNQQKPRLFDRWNTTNAMQFVKEVMTKGLLTPQPIEESRPIEKVPEHEIFPEIPPAPVQALTGTTGSSGAPPPYEAPVNVQPVQEPPVPAPGGLPPPPPPPPAAQPVPQPVAKKPVAEKPMAKKPMDMMSELTQKLGKMGGADSGEVTSQRTTRSMAKTAEKEMPEDLVGTLKQKLGKIRGAVSGEVTEVTEKKDRPEPKKGAANPLAVALQQSPLVGQINGGRFGKEERAEGRDDDDWSDNEAGKKEARRSGRLAGMQPENQGLADTVKKGKKEGAKEGRAKEGRAKEGRAKEGEEEVARPTPVAQGIYTAPESAVVYIGKDHLPGVGVRAHGKNKCGHFNSDNWVPWAVAYKAGVKLCAHEHCTGHIKLLPPPDC